LTLLSALNDVQRLASLAVTSSIVGDGQETQELLYALARRSAQALLRRHEWPVLKREHSFAMSLASAQAAGKPSDLDRILRDTAWNRTTNRRIIGPTTSVEWQRLKGEPIITSITQIMMLRYDGLHIFPVPTSADTAYYEYVCNTPVQASDTTFRTNFAADTDTFLLGDELLTLDVRWRWLQAKGLDYAEALRDAELRIADELAAQRGSAEVSFASGDIELGTGQIPEGSWDLS